MQPFEVELSIRKSVVLQQDVDGTVAQILSMPDSSDLSCWTVKLYLMNIIIRRLSGDKR